MSKTHVIRLYFNNIGLAGFEYGRASWQYQVLPTLNYNDFQQGDRIHLIWDPEVQIVTSSFFYGFFEAIAQKIGYDGITKKISIESPVNIVTKNNNILTTQDIH